jgi:SAM-dependent methyltransferase
MSLSSEHLNNPKSPKYHVKKYLESVRTELSGRVVVDLPAGNGVTTALLLQYGAKPEPFDLFPEYYLLQEPLCQRADIMSGIPVGNEHADMVICQEGIEHFSDQIKAFREFNRVLKTKGKMLITTPSYSSLAAKFSYLLFESETAKRMPPNEIDDVWMSDKSVSSEIYHGHLFLTGLQKLRIMGRLSGFKISEIRYCRLSKGSLFLLPFFYPVIWLSSYVRYMRNMKKHPGVPYEHKREVYREQLKINISVKNLLNHHTFIIFEKEKPVSEVDFRTESLIRPFGKEM